MRTAILALLALAPRAVDRPNVVLIVSDDQRADTIAALGNPHLRTPQLDSLVRDGFAFTRAYCMGSMQGAVCVPSRAMFLSGRSLFRISERLAEPHALWPKEMERAGYATYGVGKWHNGPASFARAFSAGGPVFFGGMGDPFKVKVHDFDPAGKYPKEAARTGEKYSSDLFADAADRFIRGRKDGKPFFLYLSFTVPHDPRTPPGEYATMYDPAKLPLPANFLPKHPFDNGEMEVRDEKLLPWPRTEEAVRKELAAYYGAITHMDAQIGRVLRALDETGARSNTLVVFWSDHGLALGSHGLLGKQNLYDHSMRTPLVLSGPGVPKGGRSDALCYLFDLFPTVCALAEVPVPGSVEGRSLRGILEGKEPKVRDAIFTAYRDVQRAVRTDRWKLIRYPKIGKVQLFDLAADPDELRDLSADPAHAARLAELSALLAEEQRRWGE
jgi:arylsulfatase A-like enzyme